MVSVVPFWIPAKVMFTAPKRHWAPIAIAVIGLLAIGVTGCVNVFLPAVDMKFAGPPARPPVLAAFGDDPAIDTAADWSTRRAPVLRAAFQRELYGRMPPIITPVVEARTPVITNAIGKDAIAEQWTVRVGPVAVGAGIGMAPAVGTVATGALAHTRLLPERWQTRTVLFTTAARPISFAVHAPPSFAVEADAAGAASAVSPTALSAVSPMVASRAGTRR